jgi:hypothetical protein
MNSGKGVSARRQWSLQWILGNSARRDKVSLNQLAYDSTVKLIHTALDRGVDLQEVRAMPAGTAFVPQWPRRMSVPC